MHMVAWSLPAGPVILSLQSRSPLVTYCRDPRFCSRCRLFVPRHVVACLLVSPRSVWVGTLACVGSGSRMYGDGKSDRCRFVGDRTCSIFNDHVAVSDLRSVFTIPPNLPIRLYHTSRVTCIPPRDASSWGIRPARSLRIMWRFLVLDRFYDPSEFADSPSPYSPSDLHPSTSHPTLYLCSASFF